MNSLGLALAITGRAFAALFAGIGQRKGRWSGRVKRRLDWSAMTHRNSAKRWILQLLPGYIGFVWTACCGSAFEPYRSFSGGGLIFRSHRELCTFRRLCR